MQTVLFEALAGSLVNARTIATCANATNTATPGGVLGNGPVAPGIVSIQGGDGANGAFPPTGWPNGALSGGNGGASVLGGGGRAGTAGGMPGTAPGSGGGSAYTLPGTGGNGAGGAVFIDY